jgi:hypothetical protein
MASNETTNAKENKMTTTTITKVPFTFSVVTASGTRYVYGDEYGRGARQIRSDESGWYYYGAYRHVMPAGQREEHDPPLEVRRSK